MNSDATKRPWKIHALCTSLLIMAILVETWFRFDAGVDLSEAFWNSVKAIKPMEAILFLAFWHLAVTGRWLGKEDESVIRLNLK